MITDSQKNNVVYALEQEISKLQKEETCYKKLISVLIQFDGKKITKRIETKLKNSFPDDKIWYYKEIERHYISYNGIEFCISYLGSDILDLKYFLQRYETRYTQNITELYNLANNKDGKLHDIFNIINNFNEAKNKLQSISTKGDYIVFQTLSVSRY